MRSVGPLIRRLGAIITRVLRLMTLFVLDTVDQGTTYE